MIKKYVYFFFWYINNFNNIFKLAIIFFAGKKNHKVILKHKCGFQFIIENSLDLITIKEVMNDYNILSLKKIGKGGNIIDIGGHKGYFSCFLSYLNHVCNVHCYEPNPALFEIISNHIKLNNLKNCFAHNVAIGGKDGVMKFGLYGDFNSNAGTLHFDTISHKDIKLQKIIEVEVKGINTIFDQFKSIAFLKIDCEGEEFNIFENISNENLMKLENIVCEFHEFNGNKKEKILIKFMQNHFLVQKLYYILNENKQGIVTLSKKINNFYLF